MISKDSPGRRPMWTIFPKFAYYFFFKIRKMEMATVMMGTGKTKMEICFFMNEFNIVHTEHFHASGISGKKR